MILVALLSALALAGAPASTPVTCYPDVLPGNAWGLTDWNTRPIKISLYGPQGCAAALLASMTPKQRVQTYRLNPTVNFPQVVGQGLLVDLHEASHVGLLSRDECRVERMAFALYPSFVRKFFPAAFVARTIFYASRYDAFVLDFYHCGP